HGKVNALELPSRNVQIAARFRPASKEDRIELASQILYWNGMPHVRIGHKLHTLTFHLVKTAIDHLLLHLEFGNAVAQQSTDPIRFFIDRDPMPGTIELLCRCETRRP